MVGPKGAVVIDWTNAALGDPDVDVALALVLMSSAEVPANVAVAKVLGLARSLLVNSFTSGIDLDAATRTLREVVTWKVENPHMSPQEITAMWKLVERTEARR